MPKRGRPIDELITAVPGEWEFTEQVAQSFDSHVRKSVPVYDEVQGMVVEMSEWFIRDGSTVYDIGCSTGETISLLQKKHSGKRGVRFVGVESSMSMIDVARKKCKKRNVEFIHGDVMDVEGFPGADFVTSLYTLQFLPLKHRKKVLQRINRDLSEGGALLVAEKVLAENSLLEDVWSGLYWDFKRNRGLTDAMILQKSKSLRGVLVPLTLKQNMDLLVDAGFSNVEVFVKWYNFAGIIALKGARPATPTRRKRWHTEVGRLPPGLRRSGGGFHEPRR